MNLVDIIRGNNPQRVNIMESLPTKDLLLFCENSKVVEQLCEKEQNFWMQKFYQDYPTYVNNPFILKLERETVVESTTVDSKLESSSTLKPTMNWYILYRKIFFYSSFDTIDILLYYLSNGISQENKIYWSAFWYQQIMDKQNRKIKIEDYSDDQVNMLIEKNILINYYFLNNLHDIYPDIPLDELSRTTKPLKDYLLTYNINAQMTIKTILSGLDDPDEKDIAIQYYSFTLYWKYRVYELFNLSGNMTWDEFNILIIKNSRFFPYISKEMLTEISTGTTKVSGEIPEEILPHKSPETSPETSSETSAETSPETLPVDTQNPNNNNFFSLYQQSWNSYLKFQGKVSAITEITTETYLSSFPQKILEFIFEDGNIPLNIMNYQDIPGFGVNGYFTRIDHDSYRKILIKDDICIKLNVFGKVYISSTDENFTRQIGNFDLSDVINMDIQLDKFMFIDTDNIIYHFDLNSEIEKWKQIYNEQTSEDYNIIFNVDINQVNPRLVNINYDYLEFDLPDDENIQYIKYINTINTHQTSIVGFSESDIYIFSKETNLKMIYARNMKSVGIMKMSLFGKMSYPFAEKEGVSKERVGNYFGSLILPYNNIDDLNNFIYDYFKEINEYNLQDNIFWSPVKISLQLSKGEIIDKIYTFKSGYNIIITRKNNKTKISCFYLYNVVSNKQEPSSDSKQGPNSDSKQEMNFASNKQEPTSDSKQESSSDSKQELIINNIILPFNWMLLSGNNIEQLIVDDYNVHGVIRKGTVTNRLFFDKVRNFLEDNLQDIDYFLKKNHLQNKGYKEYLSKLYNTFHNSKIVHCDLFYLNLIDEQCIMHDVQYGNLTLSAVLGKGNLRGEEYTDSIGHKFNHGKTIFMTRTDGLLSIINIEENSYKYFEDEFNVDEVHVGTDCVMLFSKGFELLTKKQLEQNKDKMEFCVVLDPDNSSIKKRTIRCRDFEGHIYNTF